MNYDNLPRCLISIGYLWISQKISCPPIKGKSNGSWFWIPPWLTRENAIKSCQVNIFPDPQVVYSAWSWWFGAMNFYDFPYTRPGKHTKSYWTLSFIVGLPINSMVMFHSFLYVYQRVLGMSSSPTDFHSIMFQRGWLKPPTRFYSCYPMSFNLSVGGDPRGIPSIWSTRNHGSAVPGQMRNLGAPGRAVFMARWAERNPSHGEPVGAKRVGFPTFF